MRTRSSIKAIQLREIDDLPVAPVEKLPAPADEGPIQEQIFPASEFRVESGAQSRQLHLVTIHLHPAPCETVPQQ